mgnify:CR=1 FL=1
MKIRSLNGMRFGTLTVVEFYGVSKHQRARWLCICDCGNSCVVVSGNLTCGKTKSCGCKKRQWISEKLTKHGMCKTPEYSPWAAMMGRCYNKNNSEYQNYGGRGIQVCFSWQDFAKFFKDMGVRPSPKHSIERIHNDKGYFPENCVWATQEEQARNTRRNRLITCFGKTQCLTAWANEFGIKRELLRDRLKSGWVIEKALEVPVNHDWATERLFTINGETANLKEWARRYNIKYTTLRARLRCGWDIVKALETRTREKRQSGKLSTA